MRVLRYLGARQVEVAEAPHPAIGDGEVLLRTAACGVCATDVKTYVRGHPRIPVGSVLGHEVSGVVAESKAHGWQVGDRVVAAPYVPCGHCRRCDKGQFTLCENLYENALDPGGFSEWIRLPARLVELGLHRLPDDVPFALGALAEPLACCRHGLDAIGLRRNDSLLIVGDGPMGILLAMAGREMGASPLLVSGLSPERLARAARSADRAVDVSREDLAGVVGELTGGRGMDKVVVAVGDVKVAESALGLVGAGGAINFFAGLPAGAMAAVDLRRLHYDEVHITGTSGFAPADFAWAAAAVGSGRLDLQDVVTRQAGLTELEQAFLDAGDYRGIKTVAVLNGQEPPAGRSGAKP